MAGTLRYSAAAELDLLKIHAYIAERSAAAASRLVRNIDVKCRMLAETPGLGARRDQLRPGMRLWTVGEYLILYRPEPDGVFVVRIVHGRRDLTQLFPEAD